MKTLDCAKLENLLSTPVPWKEPHCTIRTTRSQSSNKPKVSRKDEKLFCSVLTLSRPPCGLSWHWTDHWALVALERRGEVSVWRVFCGVASTSSAEGKSVSTKLTSAVCQGGTRHTQGTHRPALRLSDTRVRLHCRTIDGVY